MTAEILTFNSYLQTAVDEGVVSSHQAWRLHWDLMVCKDDPWGEGVQEINRAVNLFHLPVESMQRQ